MKDAVGKELQLGDKVVTTYRNYADLYTAVVIGFTPKKVKVVLERDLCLESPHDFALTKFPNQVAKVTPF